MTDKQIIELAAILINEYGHGAVQAAESRRDQNAHEPYPDGYRLWARISEATARLLRVRRRERLPAEFS
jgi:hypothetical protein